MRINKYMHNITVGINQRRRVLSSLHTHTHTHIYIQYIHGGRAPNKALGSLVLVVVDSAPIHRPADLLCDLEPLAPVLAVVLDSTRVALYREI